MKILHITLRGPVTDGWNYQDNMLIKYHRRMGHDVTMLTSKWVWGSDGKMHKTECSDYYDEDGVHFIRIEIKGKDDFQNKFKRFENVYEHICEVKPDFIFAHASQYLDIVQVARYKKNHPDVKLVVDNHVDFSNSATNWVSKNILHGIVWGAYVRYTAKYADHLYGVLPARVDFLKNVYHVPADKVSLLVMGADDEMVERASQEKNKKKVRFSYGIEPNDFLIVTGGKIDSAKRQTILLMDAVQRLKGKVKLLIFGSVEESIREEFDSFVDGKMIQYIGWIPAVDSYNYFAAANLVAFPGRHSVFWEEAAGQGKVLMCKYWDGTTHVDSGGNVKFLYKDSAEEIVAALEEIIRPEIFEKMQAVAINNAKRFSYADIAKRCLEV